jgi:hypothetical protein
MVVFVRSDPQTGEILPDNSNDPLNDRKGGREVIYTILPEDVFGRKTASTTLRT